MTWQSRERQTATILGSRRVVRKRGESAPDVRPIKLADGSVLIPECKTRKRLPRWLVAALAQARGYLPSAIPLVVISERGGPPLALLPLRDLARLLGLSDRVGEQLSLLGRGEP